MVNTWSTLGGITTMYNFIHSPMSRFANFKPWHQTASAITSSAERDFVGCKILTSHNCRLDAIISRRADANLCKALSPLCLARFCSLSARTWTIAVRFHARTLRGASKRAASAVCGRVALAMQQDVATCPQSGPHCQVYGRQDEGGVVTAHAGSYATCAYVITSFFLWGSSLSQLCTKFVLQLCR